ncbi:hypothetical protein RGCCGE502_05789 [Rhizobium grahamii CCGE 502]|uniref:Uncharacterized protein n=1 Tax=Rhizobium grahamii CCGE 502 TaxID=990285 RepID=S3IJB5_9HYPH|nr:hypothetical protein RGCCGE502_05789 [Rhizobium grahamii CCGE 502]
MGSNLDRANSISRNRRIGTLRSDEGLCRRGRPRVELDPRFGFDEVFAQLDRRSLEVMPPGSQMNRKPE